MRSPLRLIVGFPPGGGVDILARALGERLTEVLGRPVIVDNRPGAGGRLAADLLRAAPADGSVLMLAPDATVIVQPLAQRQGSTEPVFDLGPVAQTGAWSMGFGVIPESVSGGQSSGSRTGPAAGGSASVSPLTGDVAAFSRWARANAATATFGSGGAGGTTHLYGLQIAQALDLPLRHVPYKGAAPAIADVVAGHVASTVQPLGTLLVQARAGRLAIVASSGSRRSVSAPEVPTFAEVGYPQLAADFWFGLFGPPGLSAEVAARLNGHVLQAMRHAQVRERLRALDLDVREMSAAAFASQIESDWRRWREAIRSSGFNGDSE